jgi:hypothetical protein
MRSLGDIVAIVCTLDEEPNLERCLASLTWARTVVVLDSGSTDATERIARSFQNVHWEVRPFDTFAGQWGHALDLARARGRVGLALDADMAVSGEWVDEVKSHFLAFPGAGALLPFEYRYGGHPVAGSLRRPEPRLFDLAATRVEQEGHAVRYRVEGALLGLRATVTHDDRKSLARWARNQVAYAALEAERLRRGKAGGFKSWLRRVGWMPVVALVYGYLRAGGPFRSAAARAYACERAGYECLLSLQWARLELGLDTPREEPSGPS